MKDTHPEAPEQARGESWLETGRLAELGLCAASLVHELKQPLFAIKAMLQLVQARSSVPDLAQQLERVLEQVQHMERILAAWGGLVQQPGDWSQPYDPGEVLRLAEETLSHRARQRGLQLEFHVEPLPVLRGNPVALQQVVVNLLLNAMDAAAEGGRKVRLCAEAEDGSLCIRVRDDGPGLDTAEQERYFAPFYTTKPPGRGTGLGLSITRELVRRMGGEVRFEEVERGALVRVELPLEGGGSDGA